MQVSAAPYASEPIAISLMSTTGLKYRTLNCFECGSPFIDRENEYLYRVGVKDLPEEAHASVDGIVLTHCGNCQQQYSLAVAAIVSSATSVQLYLQPQSIYLSVEPVKQFRDTFCMECGKAYFSISDRIKSVVDNIVPLGLADVSKLGDVEARCNWRGCKARWHFRT